MESSYPYLNLNERRKNIIKGIVCFGLGSYSSYLYLPPYLLGITNPQPFLIFDLIFIGGFFYVGTKFLYKSWKNDQDGQNERTYNKNLKISPMIYFGGMTVIGIIILIIYSKATLGP